MTTFHTTLITTSLAFCLFYDAKGFSNNYMSDISAIRVYDEEQTQEIKSRMHDWKCRFIIQDGYHEEKNFHYVDEIVNNTNGSISFKDETNTTWTIPAPYYWIYKNPLAN